MSLRILLIAYRFPPQVGGGVYRPAKLAKYWTAQGHRVAVVTTRFADDLPRDDALAASIPANVLVSPVADPSAATRLGNWRRRAPRGGRWLARAQRMAQALSVPDPATGWTGPASAHGAELAESFGADVVVASGPPFTSFVVGRRIAKATGRPLVLDYRDAWMGYYLPERRTRIQRRVNPSIEAGLVRDADGLVAAHRSVFRTLSPLPGSTPRLFVPNGFDTDDFPETDCAATDRFTMTYAGSLTGGRNPSPFLSTLEDLLTAGTMDPKRVRLRLLGAQTARIERLVTDLPHVARVLEAPGHVPHETSVATMAESSVNLVFIRDVDPRNRHTPGKVYEVLYAGRPVLLLAPDGVTTRLARRAGGCIVGPPTDRATIERGLVDLYDAWSMDRLPDGPDRSAIAFYDRCRQAERYASFLERIVAKRRDS